MTARSFSILIGFNYSTLNNYITGRRTSIDCDLIAKISSSFDDISMDWLISGSGNMIKIIDRNAEIEIQSLKKEIEVKDKMIEMLMGKLSPSMGNQEEGKIKSA